MASNYIDVPTRGLSNSHYYRFTINANTTGNTQGNQREVTITFTAYAYGDAGYSSHWYPQSYIYVNGVEKGSAQINKIHPDCIMNTWTGYIDAGQTITVMGIYTSDPSSYYSYMPATGSHSVSVSLKLDGLQSLVGDISEFVIEDGFTIPITKYEVTYVDKIEIKNGDVIVKTIEDYNNENIGFTDDELLIAYKAQGSSLNPTYTIVISTYSDDTLVGSTSKEVVGKSMGTAYIKHNGTWKRAIPYIKVNGTWKPCLAYTRQSGSWKRCIG